ncbi:H-NS histone family protein [Gymnodinialimonas sp.]
MAQTNLEKLSVEELKYLQKETAAAIASFEDRKRAEAIAELETVAAKHGYKLADLVGGKVSKKAKTSGPAKYRHPENPEKTWTGRGRQPNWIKEALGAGKSLDDFAI